jgi:hypothetical protein
MTNRLRKNVVSLRAGQNANRVLLIDSCEITPVSEETGRWSRMDSIPFTPSDFQSHERAAAGAGTAYNEQTRYQNERRSSRRQRIYHESRNRGPYARDAADDRLLDVQGAGPISQNWTNGKIRLGRSL